LFVALIGFAELAFGLRLIAQTTQSTANFNPNNFDSANIMAAFRTKHSDLTLLSAHRGIHALAGLKQAPNVPENSLQAIGLAAQQGWESIEVDVRLTSDGVPILTHDKTWGRETCNYFARSSSDTTPFPVFENPVDAKNDPRDQLVANVPYSRTQWYYWDNFTLRDSVNAVHNNSVSWIYGCSTSGHAIFAGENPPRLQDVYKYIKDNNIQAVLILDVQSSEAAQAAWKVTQESVDGQGRPSWQSTIYKLPAGLFPSGPSDFLAMFTENSGQVNFIPVIVGGLIAPTTNTATLDNGDDGGSDEASVGTTGFGGANNIIKWLRSMERYGSDSINVIAVEVVTKESAGILEDVRTAAQTRVTDNVGMNVGNFNPVGEYYANDDKSQTRQFFRSSDGTCCDVLAQYLYNNPNNTGPIDQSQPMENADNRTSLDFIIGSGFTFVTTDNPKAVVDYLKDYKEKYKVEKRNISYMQADGGASEQSNVAVVSLNASPMSPSPGADVQLTVVLSRPSATGTVTFYEDGVNLGTASVLDGFSNLTVTAITEGTHIFTATYSGDSTYNSGQSNSVTITASASAAPSSPSTCDIYSSGGTPCVAAHSTVRALFGNYSGKLYQVKRASDGTTTDIGTLATGGYANAAAQDSFCASTTCTITMIYDQTSQHNDLAIEGGGGAVQSPDSGAVANALPISVNGNAVYGVKVTPGVGYRNNATSGVATGASPEGMYMVTSGTFVNKGCCFDYGNVETNSGDNGEGHMDALNFGTWCGFTCSGNGPWVEADLENGQYMGNGTNLGDVSMGYDFVTAMLKNDGQTTFALKGGDAQAGGLTTDYSGSLPTTKPGYIPMKLEGAIVLGTGGDNSNWGQGAFFEGAMTSGYPTDATETAVQANIVAAGYTGDSSGGSAGSGGTVSTDPAGTYTGPSDPGGSGPQDGFASPATEQPDVFMGSRPALASFNGRLYVAFQANDASHELYVTSSSSGYDLPSVSGQGYANIQMGGAPAMAEFNHQLFVAFQANDSSHELYVTSSSSGNYFPSVSGQGHANILMGGAPALAVFNNQLCASFQANDSSHLLYVTCSSDGVTWPTATQIPNVWLGSDPAMATFNGKLYVAYRSNDASRNAWIASSSDGVNFSNQMLGQTMGGSSSPALVVSNGVLYYIHEANDQGHEMLVSASTDGSTWQGPAAYLDVKMGATGPGAAAFGNGVYVGFQSNDSRNVLYVTNKVTEATSYTGPSDPGGPGPQDGLASPATEQPNDIMATKPALAAFNGKLYVAFQGVNVQNDLYAASSSTGNNFPTATQYTNLQSSSAPALAAFNNKLFMAFRGLNVDNDFYITSSQTGDNFPTATRYTNIQMGGAPALATFNSQLCAAFQANDPSNHLHVTCSSDGVTWPTAPEISNVWTGSDPAMASFNGKLYIAYRANDSSNNVWIASSSDGVNFSNQMLGQTMGGSSSPALVVSNCTLYLIYGANDQNNEMMVMSSPDGSNWQGPKAYLDVKMGATGPGAAAFAHGVSVGFQSNDARNVLFVTNGADGTAFSSGSCQMGTLSTGTLLSTSASYPRVVRLSYGSSSVNGQIIASINDWVPGSSTDLNGKIFVSTDGGNTFTYRATVPTISGSIEKCCATLFELPKTVGTFPAGTLLFAATYYHKSDPYVAIEVYASTDQGASWHYVTTPVSGGNVNGGGGLWEPAFEIANDGELVMFWSDESDSCCSQKIAQIRSSDVIYWGDQTNTVASRAHADRPGMATVTKLPNGLFFMSYEICGPAGCTVYSRTSTDGWNFGDSTDVGTRVATASGQYFEHAPTNVWAPQENLLHGEILLIGQVMLESNNQVSAQNGETIFASWVTDNGISPWITIQSPIQVPDARDNSCPNYSSALLPSLDGRSVLELASDYNNTGQCETYFATGGII
jgi:hypothetical protein